MKKASSKPEAPFIVFSVLILVSVAAGIIDFICYQKYLRGLGIGWLDSPTWEQRFGYFKSLPGAILSILSLAPYPVILIWVWLQKSGR